MQVFGALPTSSDVCDVATFLWSGFLFRWCWYFPYTRVTYIFLHVILSAFNSLCLDHFVALIHKISTVINHIIVIIMVRKLVVCLPRITYYYIIGKDILFWFFNQFSHTSAQNDRQSTLVFIVILKLWHTLECLIF